MSSQACTTLKCTTGLFFSLKFSQKNTREKFAWLTPFCNSCTVLLRMHPVIYCCSVDSARTRGSAQEAWVIANSRKLVWVYSHAPSIQSHRRDKSGLTRFLANDRSPRRTGLHLSLSAKSRFKPPTNWDQLFMTTVSDVTVLPGPKKISGQYI